MKTLILCIFFFFSIFSIASANTQTDEFLCSTRGMLTGNFDNVRFQKNQTIFSKKTDSIFISMYRKDVNLGIFGWDKWVLARKDYEDESNIVWISGYESIKENKEISLMPEYRHRLNLLDLKLIVEKASEPLGSVSGFYKSFNCYQVPLSYSSD
tara:strand:+ start:742 stop:1203 length:462 start_codon:yes stop_codon:yes gene_type:complete